MRTDITGDRAAVARLAVDRIRCTGHGICGETLAGRVRLDEWGYPIVLDDTVPADEADQAIALCPARALYLRAEPPSSVGAMVVR